MDLQKALELIQSKLMEWLKDLVRMLPNLILAIIVLFLGIYLSRLFRNIVSRMVHRLSHGKVLTNLFSNFVFIFCIGISIFAALSILNLDKALTSMLAGAGIAGLALAFAFQDIAANFMSGILITLRKPLRIGDIVKVKDYMGKVMAINLRDTVILTFQGQMVIIPNKEVAQNPIENYTMLGKRRVDLTIGVSYGEDLEKVKEVTLKAVEQIPGLSPTEPITFFFTEFADSSINFSLRLWAATPEQPEFLRIQSHSIMSVKKAFDENDITIPFPIRTLDFGIKGGQKLEEMNLDLMRQKKDNIS